jgi:hypothetical protein
MKNLLPGILCIAGASLLFACQKSHDLAAPASGEIRSTTTGAVGMESTVGTCGQFRTQSQGGWGVNPAGENPGTYLRDHFAAVFPTGLSVGSVSGYSVYYSSSSAVTAFLPAGGTAAVLTFNATNPDAKIIKNVLIGQVTALAINVAFDYADPNFAPAPGNFADLVISSGQFAGMSVNQFLFIANDVLGGTNTSYTADAINQTASAINANFIDGTMDGGFLTCPDSSGSR